MCDKTPITSEQVIDYIREQRDALAYFHRPKMNKMALTIYRGDDFNAPPLANLEVHLYEYESWLWQSPDLKSSVILRGLP